MLGVVEEAVAVPLLAGGLGDQPAGAVADRALSRRPAVTTHGPILPVWSCGGCDLPWPCPTRRRELRAEFDRAPVSLAIYMSSYLVWAAEDLVWMPAGTLHRRFVGWVR